LCLGQCAVQRIFNGLDVEGRKVLVHGNQSHARMDRLNNTINNKVKLKRFQSISYSKSRKGNCNCLG
jgi:anthranilate/para-aminobenzoate synthase component II